MGGAGYKNWELNISFLSTTQFRKKVFSAQEENIRPAMS